jgi:hypothetical protein
MERERIPDNNEDLEDLYERLFELYDLEEKGWKVDSAIQEIQKQIVERAQKRLELLRKELEDEGKGVSSTNS